MIGLLALALAYAVGSIPFGYLIVRFTSGRDVRQTGSGNIGATNVLRASGRAAGLATLVLDAAKGFLAVWLAAWLTRDSGQASAWWTSLAALAAMGGHAFPVFLKFQGGKAVASFIGAFLYLTPEPLAAVLLVFGIVVAITRYISAGSIIAAGTFPLGVWLILHPPAPVLIASIAAAWFILYRHRANLDRLRSGTERVFRWKPAPGRRGPAETGGGPPW
jgi:glycerol-3-phosphate acyltransferase PlsY